jgi:hypothetical protein
MDAVENQEQVSPLRPQALEIAQDAIPTFPPPRRGAEKWKTKKHVSHFPACCLWVFKTTRKGGLAAGRYAPPFRLILRLENAGAKTRISTNKVARRTVNFSELLPYKE